jgi:hypothetical protein
MSAHMLYYEIKSKKFEDGFCITLRQENVRFQKNILL